MFRNPPQVSFVNFGGGDGDYDAVPFGCYDTPAPYQSFTSYDPTRSNSVSVGWDQQPSLVSELNSMSVNAFYAESSGPNKRPNVGGETPAEQSSIPQQERTDRPKRKGQKRVRKKVEATPLAGMIG